MLRPKVQKWKAQAHTGVSEGEVEGLELGLELHICICTRLLFHRMSTRCQRQRQIAISSHIASGGRHDRCIRYESQIRSEIAIGF